MRHAAFLCATLFLAACAPAEPAGPDPAEVRQAIEEANAKFAEAFNNHDAAATAEFYTEDAIVMPPGAPAQRGRSSIQDAMAEDMSSLQLSGLALTTDNLEIYGDAAVEVGSYSVTLTLPGQDQPSQDEGSYLVVWKRQEDGSWKLHRDIWNSNLSPPMPAEEDEEESPEQ